GEMIAEAVGLARRADVIVACVGEAREHAGESSTRTELGLPGSQPQLLRALDDTGKPLVLVTMSGRPLALEWEDANADAILHAWFGGTESGRAIADLLFGDVNPSGKTVLHGEADVLQATIDLRNAGQIPGEEIVQLYIGDPVASRSRPVRELKGFQKVSLQPGQSQQISFRITVEHLKFFRAERL